MRVIDPTCTIGNMATDPAESRAKVLTRLADANECFIDVSRLWRLHINGTPTPTLQRAPVMETNAWNKNSRAFFAWQTSLGRECLPLLEWVSEPDVESWPTWVVSFHPKGHKAMSEIVEIVAESKAAARRLWQKGAHIMDVCSDIQKKEGKP